MQTRRDTFLLLVATLSGVSLPNVTIADDVADYLGNFVSLADKDFGPGQAEELLKLFNSLVSQGMPAGDAVHGLLAGRFDRKPPPGYPQQPYGDITRALSLFVLTGGWSAQCDPEQMIIPSSDAYTQSLVWLIAQAHAQGNSNAGPQSWGDLPDALSTFIGG